jgi:hypothetical protein
MKERGGVSIFDEWCITHYAAFPLPFLLAYVALHGVLRGIGYINRPFAAESGLLD